MSEVGWSAMAAGFAVGAGLIIAIGAQNAHVIRAGLQRRNLFVVVTVCILCDVGLIAAGAGGLGAFIAARPWLASTAAWGGAAFLLAYGAMSVRNVIHPPQFNWEAGAEDAGGQMTAIAATLSVSLLNPHVYLDTVVLLGGIAAQYEATSRLWFTTGAMLASVIWFCAIGYGAFLAAPLMRTGLMQRLLDGLVALIMFTVAGWLIAGELA
ncbi:MAG: LysE family transporter [Rhodospirillales bacterium]